MQVIKTKLFKAKLLNLNDFSQPGYYGWHLYVSVKPLYYFIIIFSINVLYILSQMTTVITGS